MQAATVAGLSLRTVQSYESANAGFSTMPPSMPGYAATIAGWTEADIQAIYNGGDPPEPRATGMSTGVAEPISEETQASVLSAIYGLRDVPARERKRLAALIESLPVTKSPQDPQRHQGSQVAPSNGGEVDAK